MALYDHRVFRVGDDWWIAQVHGGSGAGTGPRPSITHERVHFTRIGNDEDTGRTVEIPAGWLNAISYRSLRKLLERAENARFRLDMYPYNPPWADDVPPENIYTDEEGLQWTIRRTSVVRTGPSGSEVSPAVQLVCLSDSAMKREILLRGNDTYDNALLFLGRGINEELIRVVKSTFKELPDHHLGRG